jgi:hypothetical protein
LSAGTQPESNFAPANTSDTSTGDSCAPGGGGDSGNAVGFTDPFSSSYTLSQILVADNFSSASTDGGIYDDLNVGFWQSTTNDLNSATELETWSISTSTVGPPAIYTLTSVLNPVINPTDYYFITENITPDPTVGAATAEWGWQWNSLSPVQTGYYSNFAGGSWFAEGGTTPVFSVSGNAVTAGVPEPRSLALLAAGFVGILIVRARRPYGLRRQIGR